MIASNRDDEKDVPSGPEGTGGDGSGEKGLTPVANPEGPSGEPTRSAETGLSAVSDETKGLTPAEFDGLTVVPTPPKDAPLPEKRGSFLAASGVAFRSLLAWARRYWEFWRQGVLLVRRNREYSFRAPADFSELRKFRTFLGRYAARAGLLPKRISNAQLVLDELVTNVIRHAYKDREKGDVFLGFTWLRDRIVVRICDRGVEFDWNRVMNPDLEKYVETKRKGGLGILLVRKLTDEATYRRLDEENQTTLVFLLNLEEKERVRRGFLAEIRKRFTLTSRFLLIGLAVHSVFSIGLYVWGSRAMDARSRGALVMKGIDAGKNLALSSVAPLESSDTLSLNELVDSIRNQVTGVRYAAVVDTNRRFVAHTDPSFLFNEASEPPATEILERKEGDFGRYVRRKGIWEGRSEVLYDFVLPVRSGPSLLGEVRIGVGEASLDVAKDEKAGRGQVRLLVLSLWIAVGALLLYMANVFVRPIRNFSEAIAQIGTLDYDLEKLKDTRVEEFRQIEQAITRLSGRIKEQDTQLTDQSRIRREMQLAKDIQNTILPRVIPATTGFELDGRYRSALEMGGDYYDFFDVGPELMGVVVGDVSGKGIGAAFIMAIARMAMRSESRLIRRASDVLVKVDDLIRGDIKKGMYITVFYAVLDSLKRTVSYSSAGHNPMILYRKSEDAVYFLNPKGIAIGLSVEDGFFKKMIKSESISVRNGDLLFMYTDGITEAMNPQRKEYGEARLVEFIRKNADLAIADFCKNLDDDIEQFTRGYPQSDDITYIVIRAKPTEEEARYERIRSLYRELETVPVDAALLARFGLTEKAFARLDAKVKAKGVESLAPKAARLEVDPSELSHATVEQSGKIVSIVRAHPEYGAKRILDALATEEYGNVRLTVHVLNKELKKLKLATKVQRRRFAERRIASTSVHSGLSSPLAKPPSLPEKGETEGTGA